MEHGRYLAKTIPDATYVELPGRDNLPYVGDQDALLDEVQEFLTGVRHSAELDRVIQDDESRERCESVEEAGE